MKQLLNSVGIEVEVEDIERDNFPRIKFSTFNVGFHSDASCESNRYYLSLIDGRPLKIFQANARLRNFIRNSRVGFEIVTNIIKSEDTHAFKKDLVKLCDTLKKMGESEKSYRGSIHVHVNCPANLQILKKIIEMGGYLEKFFFSIGGMGYDFRGLKNDSTYCRPITDVGPPVVNTPLGLSQVFTTKNLLESTTIEEFFNQYGDLPNQIQNNYFPVRYTWLNLSPIYMDNRGSLEFRIFNKSLDGELIYQVVEFCKLFVKVAILEALKPSFQFHENSVYDDIPVEKIVESFRNVLSIAGEFPTELLELEKIINPITLERKYYYSHLMYLRRGNITSTHWGREGNGKLKTIKEKIHVPTFVDIHNLDEEEIFFGRGNNSARTLEEYVRMRTEGLSFTYPPETIVDFSGVYQTEEEDN